MNTKATAKSNFKPHNILLFLSGLVLICLAVPASTAGILTGVVCAVCLAIALQFGKSRRIREVIGQACLGDRVIALLFWAALAGVFVFRWKASGMIAAAASAVRLSSFSFLVILAVIGVLSVPFMLFAVHVLRSSIFDMSLLPEANAGKADVREGGFRKEGTIAITRKEGRKFLSDRTAVLIILVVSICVVTLCSTCSPLYPMNETSCFFTVGKSMLNGLVLYQDIFEQKGPLLYMIYAAGCLLSDTTWHGVWIIEMILCFLFLYFSYKTVRLFCSEKSVVLIPAAALFIYTQSSFCQGGLTEETCFPFLAYGLYTGIKAAKNKSYPSCRDAFIVGILGACVLWIKFTLVGFFVGWFIVPAVLLISRRNWKGLTKFILAIIAGVIILTIPIILYFIVNSAVGDLWEVYFYDNLFLYGNGSANGIFVRLEALYAGLEVTRLESTVVMIMIIISLVWGWASKNKCLFFSIASAVTCSFVFAFVGTTYTFGYYALIFSVFAPLSIPPVCSVLNYIARKISKHRRVFDVKALRTLQNTVVIAVAAICVVLSAVLTNNRSMMFQPREEKVQYQIAEIVNSVDDATLLVYNTLDFGFYTACDIVPNCRYFCTVNAMTDEMREEQFSYIENKEVDFVIVSDLELENDFYVCVAEYGTYSGDEFEGYRLYESADLLE